MFQAGNLELDLITQRVLEGYIFGTDLYLYLITIDILRICQNERLGWPPCGDPGEIRMMFPASVLSNAHFYLSISARYLVMFPQGATPPV
jgi:hypothetical protein